MGIKRRAFLIGGAAVVGGGIFAIKWADSSAASKAIGQIAGKGNGASSAWLRIAEDDAITIYSPHADVGQGSNTGLGQMLAEELDADGAKVRVVAAPAELGFANTGLGRGFLGEMSGYPGVINALPTSLPVKAQVPEIRPPRCAAKLRRRSPKQAGDSAHQETCWQGR